PEYAKELRIFESKDALIKNWKETYSAIYNFEIKNNFVVELRSFISGGGFYIFLSVMILYSIFAVAKGSMTSAVLLIIFTLCLNIFNSLPSITRTLSIIDHGLFALEKQYRVFAHGKDSAQNKSDKESFESSSDIVFETKNLFYAYRGDRLAIDDVSLTIKQGETVALVGVNGSGKSTLVKLLLQLYQPLSGNIYFYGEDYNELEKGFLKNRIGAFFQDYYLFHMPIWENVGFGDIENIGDGEKIKSALEKGGAAAFISRLTKGADTFIYKWIEETGTELSGGEKQKIAVSRAHMSNKDILIFDEPASMLDPISELEQFMNIKQKLEGQTAVLISHRVGFARLADKIILLSDGKIAEVGTHDELMSKNGMYAHFFNEQAQWYQKDKRTEESENE
ncbi:MAG: ABC transporter ATP-binding protein/permease, partial [Oscillospiraceae bacterium]|nr:ABC transporter ATP-binding protein/permease [Oscillospiraceae bacterium]